MSEDNYEHLSIKDHLKSIQDKHINMVQNCNVLTITNEELTEEIRQLKKGEPKKIREMSRQVEHLKMLVGKYGKCECLCGIDYGGPRKCAMHIELANAMREED